MIQAGEVISLQEFEEKMRRDVFWGETNIKWEAGRPVLIEVTQKLKPKDFASFIVVQVVSQ